MLANQSLKTTWQRETLAGITSFLTMVYIVFVNPLILQKTGMDQGAVFTATCLVTAFSCFLTAILANAPIGIAPGMALNVYFAYSVVMGMGIPWQKALGMVFVSGILFFILTLTRIRHSLIKAIPDNLQIAILIGISLLIALIALESNQLIVTNPHTLIQLGNIHRPEAGLFFLGFLLILLFDYYQVPAAIISSVLLISILSLIMGLTKWQGFIDFPPSLAPTFMKFDLRDILSVSGLKITLTFFLIALFDATGTLIGLLNQSIFKDQKEHDHRISNSLTADAAGSMLAAILGSASTSPFIESAAGIEVGGRTGKTAVVIAIGFLLMLFFFPLAKMIPSYAVGPALLYVACAMFKHVRDLNFEDMNEAAPALLTIIMIPFTSSIADGIGAGIILYSLLKIFSKQKLQLGAIILTVIFALFFIIS